MKPMYYHTPFSKCPFGGPKEMELLPSKCRGGGERESQLLERC